MSIRPLIASLASLLLGATVGAQTASYPVQSVKAAFLYRFVDYAEWPASRPAERPLTIAVLGDEGVADALLRSVQARNAQDRAITVLKIQKLGAAGDADILFVSRSASRQLSAAPASFTRQATLVVTEEKEGLTSGAVINFLVVEGRVRFEVSVPAAETRGLKLSSRLLNVALRVEKSGAQIEPPGAGRYSLLSQRQ